MLRLVTFGGLSICAVRPAMDAQSPSGDQSLGVDAPRQLQRRSQALLAALAAARVGELSRDTLAALLWPESRTEQARTALRQTLFRTKRDLGVDDLVLGTTDVRLNPAAIVSDVGEFSDALARGRLEQAALLYRGPFLEGFHLTEAPAFERWAEEERERLSAIARSALAELARGATGRGDREVAAGWWGRLAALDPLDETIAIAYMEALAAAGNTAAALRHARLHEALLRSELEVEPGPAERALVQRLRTPTSTEAIGLAAPRRPLPSAAPDTADPRNTHLVTPPQRTSHDVALSGVGGGSDSAGLVSPHSDLGNARARETVTESAAGTAAVTIPGNSATTERVAATPATSSGVAAGTARERSTLRSEGMRTFLFPVVSIAAIAVAIVFGVRFVTRWDQATAMDSALVAVAPFEVLDPASMLWHEGMVDVLSRALDGAGPLHTVSPTTSIRAWKGRASDDEAAAALGRATGAGLVVVGSIVQAGPDSIRVTAELLDARNGDRVIEVVRRDAVTRMDRLTDSLAVALIRALGGVEPVAAVRSAGMTGGGRSLDALKAFLRGEQAFRHARWESARTAYEQAVALDSVSPLALRRLGMVASWERLLQDSLAASYLLRAGALNKGLGPRDSLLVASDSLAAAANFTPSALTAWTLTRRLFTTLDGAVARYPKDPEVWFALGEARYHFGFGPVVGVPERATLAAFDSAIVRDSAFAPAYLHAVELGFNLGGAPLGLRYARAYLALSPTEASHRGVRLVEALADVSRTDSSRVAHMLDTVRTSALVSARTILRRWPDSAETAVRLSRLLAAGRPSEYPLFSDTSFMRRRLAQELAFRGHLTEAYEVLGGRDTPIFAELALLDAVPRDSARAVFARWLTGPSDNSRLALDWWAAQRDASSLLAFAAAASRIVHSNRGADQRAMAAYDTAAAMAYLALARGDSTTALARLLALPDTLCPTCYVHRLTRARLLSAKSRTREAIAALDEAPAAFVTPMEVVFALERARVAAQVGDLTRSRADFAFVAQAWAHADPILAAPLTEARIGRDGRPH
jgi:serine/threonine-protein kinase